MKPTNKPKTNQALKQSVLCLGAISVLLAGGIGAQIATHSAPYQQASQKQSDDSVVNYSPRIGGHVTKNKDILDTVYTTHIQDTRRVVLPETERKQALLNDSFYQTRLRHHTRTQNRTFEQDLRRRTKGVYVQLQQDFDKMLGSGSLVGESAYVDGLLRPARNVTQHTRVDAERIHDIGRGVLHAEPYLDAPAIQASSQTQPLLTYGEHGEQDDPAFTTRTDIKQMLRSLQVTSMAQVYALLERDILRVRSVQSSAEILQDTPYVDAVYTLNRAQILRIQELVNEHRTHLRTHLAERMNQAGQSGITAETIWYEVDTNTSRDINNTPIQNTPDNRRIQGLIALTLTPEHPLYPREQIAPFIDVLKQARDDLNREQEEMRLRHKQFVNEEQHRITQESERENAHVLKQKHTLDELLRVMQSADPAFRTWLEDMYDQHMTQTHTRLNKKYSLPQEIEQMHHMSSRKQVKGEPLRVLFTPHTSIQRYIDERGDVAFMIERTLIPEYATFAGFGESREYAEIYQRALELDPQLGKQNHTRNQDAYLPLNQVVLPLLQGIIQNDQKRAFIDPKHQTLTPDMPKNKELQVHPVLQDAMNHPDMTNALQGLTLTVDLLKNRLPVREQPLDILNARLAYEEIALPESHMKNVNGERVSLLPYTSNTLSRTELTERYEDMITMIQSVYEQNGHVFTMTKDGALTDEDIEWLQENPNQKQKFKSLSK